MHLHDFRFVVYVMNVQKGPLQMALMCFTVHGCHCRSRSVRSRIHFNIRLYYWEYSLCSDRQAGVITALHLQGKWLWAVTVVELVMRSRCHFYQQGLQGGRDKMDIPPSALIPSAPLSIPFTYPSTEWGILLSIAKSRGRFLH